MSGNGEHGDQVQQKHQVLISGESDKKQLHNPIWAIRPAKHRLIFTVSIAMQLLISFFFVLKIFLLPWKSWRWINLFRFDINGLMWKVQKWRVHLWLCYIYYFLPFSAPLPFFSRLTFNCSVIFINSKLFQQEMFWNMPVYCYWLHVCWDGRSNEQIRFRQLAWILFFALFPFSEAPPLFWHVKTQSADSVLRSQLEFTESVQQLGASSNYQRLSGVQRLAVLISLMFVRKWDF